MKKNKLRKISFFVNEIKEGGGPMGYSFNLLNGLKKIDNNGFSINFYETSYKCNIDMSTTFKTIYSRLKRKLSFISKQFFIINKIRKSDICIFQGFQSSDLLPIAKKYKKLVIYMPHSPTIFADERKMYAELENLTLTKNEYESLVNKERCFFSLSDYIIFPSEKSRTEYDKHFNEVLDTKKIIYLKSGTIIRKHDLDQSIISAISNIRKDHTTIITYIGRYVTHKGFDQFIAISNKLSENKSIKFVCAGDGPLRNLINSQIYNFGYISNIGTLISNSDIIIVPNKTAYYDLLPIEVSSFGKPIIFSNIGGNIDQAKDFLDSFIYDNQSLEDMAQKILQAIEKIKKCPDFGKQNAIVYNKQFNQVAFAQRWLNLFELLAESEIVANITEIS